MYLERLNQKLSNPKFLLKKEWLIQNVEFKLKMIDLELSEKYQRTVMQKVEHRIKKRFCKIKRYCRHPRRMPV